MIRYRNVRHGRVLERPTEDEWLEASSGWERIDEPVTEPDPEPAYSADNEEEDD